MLNRNFREMLSALNEAHAEFLLVGAYAMAAHGCPRATGDLDIWVRPTLENAERVWSALGQFKAPLSKISMTDFRTPDVVYRIGVPPERIDILTSITGVEFEQAWADRLSVEVDGLMITVIGLRQLHQNKLATGRPKDVLDARVLEQLIN